MVFSSTVFLFIFFPITVSVYFLLPKAYRNYWLLPVSLVFFGWSQPDYLWIILVNIAINYLAALLIDKIDKLRKPILAVGIISNLAILFYFKYFDFVTESINTVFHGNFELKNIILPIGISFFTFQGMSYLVDVYRKEVRAQKNILKVGLYIVLFPQLIAGPIVRYKDIEKEINERTISLEDFSGGIERFILGLAKKAIIANTMAEVADTVWKSGPDSNTWIIAWAGSIAYTLQIYFDFSGYSDMAIGLGRMFGFHFNENFNLPYISQNITEFWRRWHISLSTWFRDYVYIPLGGNRKHVYLNLFIIFLLTGIWHGAAWNFVLWGLWNGIFIIAERIIRNHSKKEQNKNVFVSVLLRIYTLFVINLGWVLFRAPSVNDAITYIKTMFGIIAADKPGFSLFWYFDRWTIFIMVLGIFFSTSIPGKIKSAICRKCSENAVDIMKYTALLGLLFLSIIRIVSGSYNPFIYFQF